jgi:hypothetical protein
MCSTAVNLAFALAYITTFSAFDEDILGVGIITTYPASYTLIKALHNCRIHSKFYFLEF